MSDESEYNRGYEEGYEDGRDSVEECDGECGAFDDGHEEGYNEGFEDGKLEGFHGVDIRNALFVAKFDSLEDTRVRWDAAENAWVLTQGGREIRIREEGWR